MKFKFVKSISIMLVVLFCTAAVCSAAGTQYFYDGAWHPYSGNPFSLNVGGQQLSPEMPPIVFEDYSVVPARDVFQTLGAEVKWNAESETVTVSMTGKTVKLKINSKIATVNGEAVSMPIAPKLINGKTMIPVRFVAEALGFAVEFDNKTDTVIIQGKKEGPSLLSVKTTKNKEGTALFVEVQTDREELEYTSFTMPDPDRLVIDIKNAVNKTGNSEIPVGIGNVSKIRIGQHEDSVRIVVDMTENPGYTVEKSGNSVVATVRLSQSASQPTVKPTTSPSSTESAKPSAPPASPPATKAPIEAQRYVTIDAGHGGTDPGAVAKDEDGNIIAAEKDINLAVALKVQARLEDAGVKVHMIRTTDTYVDFQQVGSIANEHGTTLFVSIHTNSVDGVPTASGIETYGFLTGGTEVNGMTSKQLSQNILDELISATGAKNRGVRDGSGLAVVRTSAMPATLVELGFITNADERLKMMSDEYRNILAQAIADGILKSLDQMGI